MLDNGRGRLEPFVLTAGRRPRYESVTVEGLGLLPGLPFYRVAVVRPKEAAGAGAGAADAAVPVREGP